jgi:hypothetical protein
MMSKLSSKAKAAVALAGALLLFAGCGNERNGSGNAALNPISPGGSAPGTSGDLTQLLRGTYRGSLSKIVQYYNQEPRETSLQGFTLTLNVVACPQNPQAQCAQGTFWTSGEAGTANQHTFYMSYLGYTNGTSGTQIHVLQQYPASKIPGFYDKSVAIELRVALVNGTSYDPAQSKTRVMDCVLSQGAYTCRSDVNDVRFVSGLGKS